MRMRVFIAVFLVVLSSSYGRDCQAQNAVDAIVPAVMAAAVVAAITIETVTESLEVEGTRHMLANHPEIDAFNLKVMDWDGKKLSDAAAMRLVVFRVKEIDIEAFEVSGRKVLLMFTSPGWINQQGVNFDKVRFELLGKEEWEDWMMRYISLATEVPLNIESGRLPILIEVDQQSCERGVEGHFKRRSTQLDSERCFRLSGETVDVARVQLRSRELDYLDVKDKERFCLPLYDVSGDTYIREKRSDYPVLVRNERAMGIYDPVLDELVLLQTRLVNRITDFLRLD
ncbi:hypothetical protein OAO65_03335 [Flavobacteriales bacterium]|nr:hypothetical protein [Flavobacteriales bacterium]